MRSLVLACLLAAACGREKPRLIFAAYTAPREVYHREILPAFRRAWQARTGQELRIDESYQGSGAQSRAIAGGFEADVVALALDPDIDRLTQAGLIRHDWRAAPNHGIVATSLVALAVRTRNPLGIHDFPDLARPGLQVIMPNPRISGGAMWNVSAIWGAARRRGEDADARLERIMRNVAVLDKGARESINTFEQGIGDVAVTYESEIFAGRAAGRSYDAVLPPSTLLIRLPAAVVDVYADEHGTREAAEALLAFLHGPEAQAAFVRAGFRPADYQSPNAFTIDDLGGWKKVREDVFGKNGAWARAAHEGKK